MRTVIPTPGYESVGHRKTSPNPCAQQLLQLHCPHTRIRASLPACIPHTPLRFVIKTSDESGNKVFLNVCADAAVPLPDGWSPGEPLPPAVKRYLEAGPEGSAPSSGDALMSLLAFPMWLSDLRRDSDHTGAACGGEGRVVTRFVQFGGTKPGRASASLACSGLSQLS